MMNAVAYIRRSKESTERTVSLDVQEAEIRRYADTLGATVASLIIHDGISGGDSTRFTEIHAAVKDTDARVVIVYHLDRYARDTEAFLSSCRFLAKRGVDLHVVGRGRIDLRTASGRLLSTVEAAVAEHYRILVSEKTKDALALRRAQGKRVSRFAPFGYRFVNGRVEPYPDQQRIISQIYKFSDLGFTYRDISKKLAVHLSTIHTLLKRRNG